MKRVSIVGALLFLGFLLAWSPAFAQVSGPTSRSADPAQLATAAVVPVKVDANGTDTILVINAAQSNATTAATVHLRFYNKACTLKTDIDDNLTKQDVDAYLVSDAFGATTAGVVVADQTTLSSTANFALSAVIIDATIIAVYERQGSPLFYSSATAGQWGGFSAYDVDDWFLGGYTTLQFMCPASGLKTAMNALSGIPADTFATTIDANLYDYDENLKKSVHGQTCSCFTDSSLGDLSELIGYMDDIAWGTMHLDFDYKTTGWRVIADGTGVVYWDGRLRRDTR